MGIYLFITLIAIILLLIRNSNLYSNISYRSLIYFSILIFLFIIYVFRSLLVGRDYLQYYTWYSLYNLSEFKDTGAEIGYAYLSSIARFFNYFEIIPIFTFIVVLISIFCVGKCSTQLNNGFTLLSFFMLLGLFTSMFNPIRESIAFGFISLGVAFLLVMMNYNYNSLFTYFIYLIFVILAYGFHKTALFSIIFLVLLILKRKYNKTSLIIIGLLMIWLSFTGYINKIFTNFISLDSDYASKYQHTSLNVKLSFGPILIKIGPLLVQLIFLYIFISKYAKFNNKQFNFILWGYLFYLFMFTAPGSDIARRLQMYTFIFPLVYSCLFVDGLNIKGVHIDKISSLTKVSFVSFWVIFYILKLFFNASGIIPYSLI